VPLAALEALADPDDRDGDGISGRLAIVPALDGAAPARRVGRFGWKAEQPDVRHQVGAAFLGDLGLTSSVFPRGPCTARQAACERRPHGGAPEVAEAILRAVTTYVRLLGVPARRNVTAPAFTCGERAFLALGCAGCHSPRLRTGVVSDLPELSHVDIVPYTDLLLHDMGEGLTDGRPVQGASAREWRTPPLWGIGLLAKTAGHVELLHDGRARGYSEAVLWHDGEAKAARDRYVALPAEERRCLIAFLESL
jgi:CxxC motif-containing protein (DUF1111 family)